MLTPTLQNIAYGDDPAETLDVYIPPNPSNRKLPMWMEKHGGGWGKGSKGQFNLYLWDENSHGLIEEIYETGAIIISINYPLVSDSTKPNYVPQNTWPVPLESVKKAIKFARAHAAEWSGDADRLYSIGGSAGGHLALCAAFDDDVTARPDGVCYCWTPTSVTKQQLVSPPTRPAQWNLFGCSTKAEFDAIPDSVTQDASPFWRLVKNNGSISKYATFMLGIYQGDPTKTNVNDFHWPVNDPHGSMWSALLNSAPELTTGLDYASRFDLISLTFTDNAIACAAVRSFAQSLAVVPVVKPSINVHPGTTQATFQWTINTGNISGSEFVNQLDSTGSGAKLELAIFTNHSAPEYNGSVPQLDVTWEMIRSMITMQIMTLEVFDYAIVVSLQPIDISNYHAPASGGRAAVVVPQWSNIIESKIGFCKLPIAP